MKTPEQIARDTLSPTIEDVGVTGPLNHSLIYRWVERAIHADRTQRDLYELIAEALDDRGDWDDGDGENAQRAAALIRAGTEDYIWDRYIGPMLDDLMQHLGEAEADHE